MLVLTEIIKTEMRFTLAAPDMLLGALAEKKTCHGLLFIQEVLHLTEQGTPFPTAWIQGVRAAKNHMALTEEDTALVLRFGEMIGSTDLDGQLDQIGLLEEQLRQAIQQAGEKCVSTGKLYRSLGVLSGIALVILLW